MVIGTSYADFTDMFNSMEEQQRLESHAMLKACADKAKAHNIPCKAIAIRGDPREQIVQKVTEVSADVLIMGSRGLGTLKRTLLGSVSDHCAHNVAVPIIIVKEPHAK
jgi:nucleotide-binding universal stress UspA family protein